MKTLLSDTIRVSKPALLAKLAGRSYAAIEASAGTGKTYTIENLFIHLLLSDETAAIENLLVVTFTEKATGELRTRLREKIQALLSANQSDSGSEYYWEIGPKERARLERALFSFDSAAIHTIHGFCQRVLKEFAFHNGQLLEQNQIDGNAAFARTFRHMLRDTFSVDEAYAPLLQSFLCNDTLENLESVLNEAMRLGGEIVPAWDLQAIAGAIANLGKACEPKALVADCKGAKRTLRNVERVFNALAEFENSKDITAFTLVIEGLEKDLTIPKKACDSTRAFLEQIENWGSIAPGPRSRLVQLMLPSIRKRLDEEKRRQGAYDYQDMIERVHASLAGEHGEALAQGLRRQYRAAIVDEFQDTDRRQWEIFRTVFYNGGANGLYVVGDPKQAIYGFRGADVQTYNAAAGKLAGTDGLLRLDANYRSTQPLIDAYNLLLEDTREPNAGDNPNEFFSGFNRYPQKVACGKPKLHCVDGKGNPVHPVRLLQIESAETQLVKLGPLREALGRRIAAAIAQLLTPAGAVHLIDGEGKPAENNRIHAGDMYVLTETTKQGVEMAGYLRDAGVPYAFYKQDGLFQTAEAADVSDVLAAIENPGDTALRLKAWATPFFAVAWKDLPGYSSATPGHPFYDRLLMWKAMADREDFGRLFTSLIDDSGVVQRALFSNGSERESTNYRHLCEILLEAATQSRGTLRDIRRKLDNYISGDAKPESEDGNVQRIESERAAVQIMTLHKSKGLQAGAVFLFALAAANNKSKVKVFHDAAGRRCLWIGSSASPYAKAILDEEIEERQRLIYVGVTRAEGILGLPYVGAASAGKLKAAGYGALNNRISVLAAENRLTGAFAWDTFQSAPTVPSASGKAAKPIDWKPSPVPPAPPDPNFDQLRREHAAWRVTSYSQIKRQDSGHAFFDDEEKAESPVGPSAVTPGPGELRGGIDTGIYLHALLENVDPQSLRGKTLAQWSADPQVLAMVTANMRRHRIAADFLDHSLRLVYRTMTHPLVGTKPFPGVAALPLRRELEFVYPIPETFHPPLGSVPPATEGAAPFAVGRGYLRGFIDALFEHNGKIYVTDWKSDLLPAYDDAAMNNRVENMYRIQLAVYTLAAVKMLHLHSPAEYDERFGGVLYVFLRGLNDTVPQEGVYFRRPSWDDVLKMEQQLLRFEHEL